MDGAGGARRRLNPPPALPVKLRTLLLALFLLPSALAAQGGDPPPPAVPNHRFALDVGLLSASVSYAGRLQGDWFMGAGGGVGGEFISRMIVGGRHFGQSPGIVYETPDGYGGDLLFEMVHLNLFARYEPAGRWQFDTGVRGSVFLHFDESDDDPGGGAFLGTYAAAYWGWKNFKVGPRVLVGVFTEDADTREFGINVAPLTFRIVVP